MALLNVYARAGVSQLWALLSGCVTSYDCYTHPIDFCAGCERDTVLKGAYREKSLFPESLATCYINNANSRTTNEIPDKNKLWKEGVFILAHGLE